MHNNTSTCASTNITVASVDEHGDHFAFAVDTVLTGCVCFVGIVVNMLTFAVLWVDRLRSSTFYFLLALSVADTFYLVHALLFQFFRSIYPKTGLLQGYFRAWPYIEPFEYPLGMMALTASIWIIMMVAVDRYVAIAHPFKISNWSTAGRNRLKLTVLILVDVVFNSLWFFRQRTEKTWNECTHTMEVRVVPFAIGLHQGTRMAHSISFLTFVYGIPLLVLLISSFLLVNTLRQNRSERQQLSHSFQSIKIREREGRITAMLIVIVILYLLCQTPVFVNHILYAQEGRVDLGPNHRYYNIITNFLVAFNSAFNFFVYYIFVRGFRKRSKDVLCCCCHGNGPMTSASTLQRSTVMSYSVMTVDSRCACTSVMELTDVAGETSMNKFGGISNLAPPCIMPE
ncbi:FMRFamide receptor-like [Lingula anatina]|uniref:FMRFamide receptor-like n=1 Tax=Lingula anatina TaxID=7574 RepID=A0A1S3HUU5_LINAN|nr:FMRFamide receptor-like [Lingula anatina]|eukprot:XP_013389815.1 FMRFamide receptor-like [Lingula anatina]